jgi:hypothetical protein
MPTNTTRPDVPEATGLAGTHAIEVDPERACAAPPPGPRPTLLARAAREVRRVARFVYRLLTEVP